MKVRLYRRYCSGEVVPARLSFAAREFRGQFGRRQLPSGTAEQLNPHTETAGFKQPGGVSGFLFWGLVQRPPYQLAVCCS